MSPQARETKENKQMGYNRLKRFCTAKENINKIKTVHRMGEHIYQYMGYGINIKNL